jgi:hypothetical protein
VTFKTKNKEAVMKYVVMRLNLRLLGISAISFNRKVHNKLRPLVQYRQKRYGNIGTPNRRKGGGEGGKKEKKNKTLQTLLPLIDKT